ncbi:MAG: FG-GAP-like repeat-containing protein [Acidobacteriota bacterium]|nr:FG-GAP-like repeat-containing protein [Acidobacteriota bacterium]
MSFHKNLKLFAFILILTSGIFAAPGDLDRTFGHVGFKTTSITGAYDRGYGIVRQPDGKIILVGNRNEDSGSAITLIRYNADGSLDTTFDGDGKILDEAGRANAVALQADGKIVITGKTSEINGTFFSVFRYNSDGSLDSSFGNNGKFKSAVSLLGNAIAILPDGKIVVAGTGGAPFSNNFAAARLNPNGTFDTTFNGSGTVNTSIGDSINGTDIRKTLAIQPDGKIIVGGTSQFGATGKDFTLVRYNSSGSLDSTFGGGGIVQTSFDNSAQNEFLQSIALDSSGRIVAAGYAGTANAEQSFALARYNSDGSLDSSFSDDGKLIIKTRPNTFERANAVAIQTGGKILIAGTSGYSRRDFTLVRFNSNGTLDTNFGLNGAVYTRVSEEISGELNALTIAPNGDIFGGGLAENGSGGDAFAFTKYNQNGVSAPEFGVFGYVTNSFPIGTNLSYEAKSVALQPDGKFLAAGNFVGNSGNSNGILARYEPNGSLDRNFNSQFLNSPSANTREITAVALQSDGKILIVGNYEGNSDAGLFISRYNPNGSIDSTFGNSGQTVISVFNGGGLGQDITVLPDGKIVIAGATANIATQLLKFAVFKLNANGSRDTTFGSNGLATTSFSAGNDVALSIGVQTDGKIVASGAGNFDLGSNGQIALARFNVNGSIDTSFGASGKVTTEVGAFLDIAADVQLQTDGNIVIGGVSCTDGNCNGGNGLIFRYNTNGSLDSTFDSDGKVFIQPPNSGAPTAISSIAIQPDGKIVGGGAVTNNATQSDVLITRYNTNGSPDSAFGTNGIASADINSTEQIAYSIALQPDGKIIAVGSSATGTLTDFAVWRFVGDEVPTLIPSGKTLFDFDGDRKTDISIFRPASGQWWYLRSSDGANRVFQFGGSTDKLVPADFTGDGKTDLAVWRESTGEWFILRSEDNSFFSVPFGTSGDIPAPSDFDGDGKADFAVFRPSSGTWYIVNSTGGTRIQQFGIAEDKPVVADYDGDGKSDLAIFRPSNSQWWISRSTGGTVVFQFGQAGDKTVQADYTGDGKTDIAVWRPSSGNWFVLRSENNSFYSAPFGTNGDIPAPGDYDGDGKSDFAVFRPSSSVWYKSQSANGFEAVTFGINGDIPIPNVFVR